AAEATVNGYDVELLTSQPNVVEETVVDYSRLTLTAYQRFEDLAELMEDRVRKGDFNVVVHSAAVSDYHCSAVFAPSSEAHIAEDGTVSPPTARLFDPVESSTKIASRYSELWLRLTPT